MTDFEHVDFDNAGYRIVMTPEKWESIQRELNAMEELKHTLSALRKELAAVRRLFTSRTEEVDSLLDVNEDLREEIATLKRQAAEDDMVIDRILTKAFGLPCGPDGCYVDPEGDSEFGRKGAADVAQIVAERAKAKEVMG